MMVAAVGRMAKPVVEAEVVETRVGGRALNRWQQTALMRAAMLASGSVEQRRQAAALVRRVEQQLAGENEAEAVEAGIADTVERLRRTGAEVEVGDIEQAEFIRDRFGGVMRHQGEAMIKVTTVRRVSRVDGVESLWRAGGLSDGERQTALRYRSLYEAGLAPLGSSLGDPERSTRQAVSSDRLVWAGLDRGAALVYRTEIGRRLGDNRVVAVLDAVAGRGETIRSLGAGGDANGLNRARLRQALAVVASVVVLPLEDLLANQER